MYKAKLQSVSRLRAGGEHVWPVHEAEGRMVSKGEAAVANRARLSGDERVRYDGR